MGFFSWKTADTGEAIMNCHSGRCKKVYMLQPGGRPAIAEPSYDGYGIFGGIDAYAWLAEENGLCKKGDPDARSFGIGADCGRVLVHEDGMVWAVFNDERDVLKSSDRKVGFFPGRWDEPIPYYGKSANDLISEGLARSALTNEFMELKYPLKFSFDPKAVYEELPPSQTDDGQGFFTDDE